MHGGRSCTTSAWVATPLVQRSCFSRSNFTYEYIVSSSSCCWASRVRSTKLYWSSSAWKLRRAASRSPALAWAAARFDSTSRRIRPQTSSSHEKSRPSWKFDRAPAEDPDDPDVVPVDVEVLADVPLQDPPVAPQPNVVD